MTRRLAQLAVPGVALALTLAGAVAVTAGASGDPARDLYAAQAAFHGALARRDLAAALRFADPGDPVARAEVTEAARGPWLEWMALRVEVEAGGLRGEVRILRRRGFHGAEELREAWVRAAGEPWRYRALRRAGPAGR